MKKLKYLPVIILLITAAAVFTAGCATQPVEITSENPPGFWWGLVHGFILFFSFIASLFTSYEIYAFPNSGGWYDLGFLLGVMMFFGGGGAGTRR